MTMQRWLRSGLRHGRQLLLVAAVTLGSVTVATAAVGGYVSFEHAGWNQLLHANVVTANDGLATSVDYAAMLAARPELQ